MNSYRENLQEAVGTSLDALYTEQTKLQSQETSAQYSLYYAQGAQLTAQENLATTCSLLEDARLINQQGVKNDNLTINLVASANLIQTNAATTVSNSATSAASIQTAANAISKLAADVGSALNIAAAACYGTDIYKKTLTANGFIRETANKAEFASQQAMEASYKSSEVIAKELAAAGAKSKTELETLLTAANTQFEALSVEKVTDQQAVATASKKEKAAEGVLEDAQKESEAIDSSVSSSNDSLNFGITAAPKITSGVHSIDVAFSTYEQPFTTLPESCSALLGGNGSIPAAVENYYVFAIKADKKSDVKLEQVDSIFGEFQSERFVQATVTDNQCSASIICTGEGAKKDLDGAAIVLGTNYVVCMYAVLTLDYQKYLNEFSNVLSSPTASVMLVTDLPLANNVSIEGDDQKSVQFTLSETSSAAEYRVMLLPADQPVTGGLLTDGDTPDESSHLHFYFNKAIAEQVSPANYTIAHLAASSTEDDSEISMIADIPSDMTDNFGSPLIAGNSYIPVVLTMPEPTDTAYAGRLSDLEATPQIVIPLSDTSEATEEDTTPVKAAKKARAAKKTKQDDE